MAIHIYKYIKIHLIVYFEWVNCMVCKLHLNKKEVTQSCPTLCDPMDCSLPGPSVHGIFQA